MKWLVLLSLIACTPKADPGADPAWLAKAKQTGGALAVEAANARKTATKVDDEDRKAVDGVLDRASASPTTADGIKSAALMISEGEKIGKGADAPVLEKSGGLAVLVDLVTRTCDAHANDGTVVAAIDAIKLSDEQQRNTLRVAAKKCGAKPSIGP